MGRYYQFYCYCSPLAIFCSNSVICFLILSRSEISRESSSPDDDYALLVALFLFYFSFFSYFLLDLSYFVGDFDLLFGL